MRGTGGNATIERDAERMATLKMVDGGDGGVMGVRGAVMGAIG